ncbi:MULTISPECIES: hypothetical protein [unclassified Lacinutrix]|uniref:hypothetical protein n=1 Tax=unclassified Lacinutrix TaxID=2647285 RepID=UPI00020A36A1|nr:MULTISPECIES: hypothetical protein [unclassified Lacinutrix]AEH02231.1 hypothetical protein Lacal_2389 [Lacinutrix sp. 5H-3-7-4]OIQ23932.1 MAG: hypothetical protein BM549_01090 [Lacinutrix sp. MedPE-SW]
MQKIKNHIIIKCASLLLVLAVALPTVVKAFHVFESHEHVVCVDKSTTHIHATDFECEFYKFKLNNAYALVFNKITILKQEYKNKRIYSFYKSIVSQNYFDIKQRGPPHYIFS